MRDLVDVHTHTIASGHAYNTMMEMIRAAQEKEPERADLLQQLMSVRSTDLDRSLQAIDRRYPSIEAYFFREYGLDAAALERLRDLYLE